MRSVARSYGYVDFESRDDLAAAISARVHIRGHHIIVTVRICAADWTPDPLMSQWWCTTTRRACDACVSGRAPRAAAAQEKEDRSSRFLNNKARGGGRGSCARLRAAPRACASSCLCVVGLIRRTGASASCVYRVRPCVHILSRFECHGRVHAGAGRVVVDRGRGATRRGGCRGGARLISCHTFCPHSRWID